MSSAEYDDDDMPDDAEDYSGNPPRAPSISDCDPFNTRAGSSGAMDLNMDSISLRDRDPFSALTSVGASMTAKASTGVSGVSMSTPDDPFGGDAVDVFADFTTTRKTTTANTTSKPREP